MVFTGWSEDYIKSLIDNPEVKSIDGTDESGYTALMWAVKNRNQDLVLKLLESGKKIDIDAYNSYNSTALHLAVNSENPEIVQLLVKHHADICTCGNEDSPLITSLESRNDRIIDILLDSIPDDKIDECLKKETRLQRNAFDYAIRVKLPKVLDKMLSMLRIKKIRLDNETYNIMIRRLQNGTDDGIMRVLLRHNVIPVDKLIKKAQVSKAAIEKLKKLQDELEPKVVIQAQRVEPQRQLRQSVRIAPIVLLTLFLL